ncbi:hypothetical protein ABZ714_09240 [Streptomyces sp. NPDC006798]|uniref:hypothetical protein n=1 Tax=Streptomyces sp. NPDC006798 TaxID=3155462 RepID=UPI0033D9F227
MLTLSTWRARFDPLSDAPAVARRTGGQIAGLLAQNYGWYRHEGDLVLPEDTDLDVSLVVDGDLVVHGFLDDWVSGTGMLVVLGDLVLRDLVSWGSVHVTGDLRAHGIVHSVYNDHVFEVGGAVHARALVLSDKSADYRTGEVEAEIDPYYPTRAQLRAARGILVPQVYDGWRRRAAEGRPPKLRRPSYDRVRSRLHRDKPLFREDPPTATGSRPRH